MARARADAQSLYLLADTNCFSCASTTSAAPFCRARAANPARAAVLSHRLSDNPDIPLGIALKGWGVEAERFAPPPQPLLPLCPEVGEPVLPLYCSHRTWRFTREGVAGKQRQNTGVVLEQKFFSRDDPRVLAP